MNGTDGQMKKRCFGINLRGPGGTRGVLRSILKVIRKTNFLIVDYT